MIMGRQTARGSEEEEEESGAGTWLGRTTRRLAQGAQKYCVYNVYTAPLRNPQFKPRTKLLKIKP